MGRDMAWYYRDNNELVGAIPGDVGTVNNDWAEDRWLFLWVDAVVHYYD